jgi:hypothetical protein
VQQQPKSEAFDDDHEPPRHDELVLDDLLDDQCLDDDPDGRLGRV